MSTFPCRDCGEPVQWATSKAGKHYLDQPWVWDGDYSTRAFHKGHRCTPNPTWEADQLAASIAAGRIVKHAPVIVFKGRKVPVGTTGIITWIGQDNYGAARVGIRTESGDVVYTAQANVKINQLEEATK